MISTSCAGSRNVRSVYDRKPSSISASTSFVGDARQLAEPALGPVDAVVELVVRHDLDVPADELATPAGRSARAGRWPATAGLPSPARWPGPAADRGTLPRSAAGCRALGIMTCSESFQRTMSMRSPPSSSTTFLMRLPRTPTQAPTQSTFMSMRADGDLGAVAGLAGDGLDLDGAVVDFGDFRFEQAAHEVRMAAAQDDLDALAGLADVEDDGLDAFADVVRFAGDLSRCAAGSLRSADPARRWRCRRRSAGSCRGPVRPFGGVLVEDAVRTRPRGSSGSSPAWRTGRRCGRAVSGSIGSSPCLAVIWPLVRSMVTETTEFVSSSPRCRGRSAASCKRRFDAFEDDVLGDVLLAVHHIDDPQQFWAVHHKSSSIGATSPLPALAAARKPSMIIHRGPADRGG